MPAFALLLVALLLCWLTPATAVAQNMPSAPNMLGAPNGLRSNPAPRADTPAQPAWSQPLGYRAAAVDDAVRPAAFDATPLPSMPSLQTPSPRAPSPRAPSPDRPGEMSIPGRATIENPLPSALRPSAAPVAVPLPPAPADQTAARPATLALPPPGRGKADSGPLGSRAFKGEHAAHPGNPASFLTVGGSLAMVLGLFLVLAWVARRASPNHMARLPKEVFDVLGRAPLSGRQQVHLLRCGSKLLLVSVTPTGTETLTEITDPQEVDRLAGLCQQGRPDSSTSIFRNVLEQFARNGQRQPSEPTVAALSTAATSAASKTLRLDAVIPRGAQRHA